MTERTSEVAQCTVPECVYNHAGRCCARAITVGSGEVPECHTFFSGNSHAPRREQRAGVGACRIYACRYNRGFDCTAGYIHVGYGAGGSVACVTFSEQ